MTKLNTSIIDNNNELLKIGEIRFNVSGTGVWRVSVEDSNFPCEISVMTTGVTFDDNTTVKSLANTAELGSGFAVTKPAMISIQNKYNLQTLNFAVATARLKDFDVNTLKYCQYFKTFFIDTDRDGGDVSVVGDLTCLDGSKNTLKSVMLRSFGMTFRDEDLPYMPNVTYFDFIGKGLLNINNILNNAPLVTDIYTQSMLGGDVTTLASNNNIIRLNAVGSNNLKGNISGFANWASLQSLDISSTNVTGRISSILNLTNLKSLGLPSNVEYTSTDAGAMNSILSGNGGSSFRGGKLVDAYS